MKEDESSLWLSEDYRHWSSSVVVKKKKEEPSGWLSEDHFWWSYPLWLTGPYMMEGHIFCSLIQVLIPKLSMILQIYTCHLTSFLHEQALKLHILVAFGNVFLH